MTTAVPVRWPETGELNRRVVIRRWTDNPNAAFAITPVHDAGITRWAKIAPRMGVSYWGQKQIAEEVTHWIWLRFAEGTRPEQITGEHVIDHTQANRRYRVVRALNAADAGIFTVVEVKELGAID